MKNIRLLLFLLPLLSLNAEEWTRFRGPEGIGVTQQKDVPSKWDASSVVWKIDLPGYGQSSPDHWDGKLFLTAATNHGRTRHTLCIDKATGKILWEKTIACNDP